VARFTETPSPTALLPLRLQTQVQEAPDARPLPPSQAGGYDIELRDVAFGYREGSDILRSVSLR
jgi:hypothetical protein